MKFFKFLNKAELKSGFTYVEAILSITLTLIAAGAISFGIAKGVRTHKSFALKESALKELIAYTEEYRMMIAIGERPLPGKQPRNGQPVVLYNPQEENKGFTWSGDQDGIVKGVLWRYITDKSLETAGDQSGYYNIKTWIEWEDDFVGRKSSKHIMFEVDQAILSKN